MKITQFKGNKAAFRAKTKKGGRNNFGRITVRHQGGGHKQTFRKINWSRKEDTGIVTNFEYDPNRTAYLAKIFDNTTINKNNFYYILAPKGLKIFDKIKTFLKQSKNIYLAPGDFTILANFEIGDLIHSLENVPNNKTIYARAAGTYCQTLQHSSLKYAKVRLPSGNQRLISLKAKATLGVVSNEKHNQKIIGKAGRSRWLNIRPTVRGVAMNPVDHPHGGGQGKTKGGRPSVTPYSLPTKGQPTRNKRKYNNFIIKVKK